MKRLSLNGKDFGCPESWKEITLEQLLKIQAEPLKPMDAIVICTGISESEWNKSNDLVLIEEIEQTLSFLNSPEGCELEEEPTKIRFNLVEVTVFSDIGTKSIAQYQDLKLLINEFHLKEGNEVDVIRRLSLYPKIVATYLQPYIDNILHKNPEYDYKKADEYAKQLYKHSAVEVSAWGYFFIQRFQELRNGIVNDAQKLITNQKKQKRGFLGYLKKWVGGRFSIHSEAVTLSSTKK